MSLSITLPPLRWAIAITAMIAAPAVPALAFSTAHGPAARPAASSCPALGAYQIGPRLLPLQPSPPQHSGAQPAPAMSASGQAGLWAAGSGQARPGATIAWPLSALTGALTITAYSPCGAPTAGTFSVHRLPLKAPIRQPNRHGATLPCAVPCFWPPTGVISATGRFVQDTLHPDDPTFVAVSATISMARPGPMMGRPCSTRTGCPPPSVAISSASFSAVTGYLQVAPGNQSATLTFLPPPNGNSAAAPSALALQGWRGVKPSPSSTPAPQQ